MRQAFLKRCLTAATAAALALAGCAPSQTVREREAAARAAAEAAAIAARTPPPITLSENVAQAASIYVAFTRDLAAMEGGFDRPEAIQAALRRGASYDPAQLSRGLVAYASIVALQSPEFVEGVRQYAVDRTVREELAANIASDPRWASFLPGADAAAALVTATLRQDIDALGDAADSIENDAYAIQQPWDPRRSWGVAHVVDRESRLEEAKVRSGQAMTPSGPDTTRLRTAAREGRGLTTAEGVRRRPPYPPAVERALALAALAALGAAGDDARAATDALQVNPTTETCLSLSKLMLFQCLAASRPSYEDMFCLGRHVVRDLATCARGAAMPAALVSVSGLTTTDAGPPTPRIAPEPLERPRPAITPAPLTPAPQVTPAPTLAPTLAPTPVGPADPEARRTPAPATAPAPARSLTPTERLNTQPGG